MRTTFEVVVWDGARWFRPEPPIRFDSEQEAQDAIAGLHGLASAIIMTSAELDAGGLPTAAPDELALRRLRA